MKRKAVFFDRDDTLIIDKVYLNDPNLIEYMPNVFSSLKKLIDNNFELFIISNQSGIARGLVTEKNLKLIHDKMEEDFAKHDIKFTGIYFCPHLPESNHPDRKPNIGMILKGEKDHGIDLKQSWVVGDRLTDIEAGRRAGCRTILLKTSYSRHTDEGPEPHFEASNLEKMAEIILSN
jgi:D-glycero-D-manno-heptose 1,7-bisphosphate phosphatase